MTGTLSPEDMAVNGRFVQHEHYWGAIPTEQQNEHEIDAHVAVGELGSITYVSSSPHRTAEIFVK